MSKNPPVAGSLLSLSFRQSHVLISMSHAKFQVWLREGARLTVGQCRQGQGFTSFSPTPRPYGKDVSRLDYWLAYESIMKKVGGRPHWAKVGLARQSLTPCAHWAAAVSQSFHQRAPLFSRFFASPRLGKVALSKSQEGGAPLDPASLCIRGPAAQRL